MGSDEGEGGDKCIKFFTILLLWRKYLYNCGPDPPPDHSAGDAGGGDIESSRIWRKTAPAANLSSTDNVQITVVLL